MHTRSQLLTRSCRAHAFCFLCVALLSGLSAGASAGAGRVAAPETVPHGTFAQSLGGQPTSLDPAKTNRVHDDQVMWSLHDALLHFSPDAKELAPTLAERWQQSPDGLTTTFFLRTGVRFHDDPLLYPEAVKASYERQYLRTSPSYTATPANAYERVIDGFPKEIRVVDSHTVTITTHYPRPHQFAIVHIVNPKVFQANKGDLSRAPVGTGPFRLAAWEGDQITLVSFAESWRGQPKLGGVRFVVMASDIDEMETLAVGQFDLAVNINPDSLERLASNPNANLVKFGGLNTMFLGNLIDRPLIKDRRVREAITRAVDWERISAVIGRGTATAVQGVLPLQCLGFDSAVGQPAYDPNRARALLREVGAASQFDLRLLHFSPSQLWSEVARAVRTDLEKVGIRVELVSTENWQDFQRERGKSEHDLYLTHWVVSAPDPERFPAPLFDSKSPNNYSRLVDPRIDRLLARAGNL